MKYKYQILATEFGHLRPRLQAMVLYVNHLMEREMFIEGIWTSFYRPKRKGKRPSVHNFMRGADLSKRVIDLRTPVRMRNVTKEEIEAITRTVNRVFPYGKRGIKSCIYHRAGRNPFHFHMQVKS